MPQILLFGLPVILNLRLLVPFLAVPAINLVVAVTVVQAGWVAPASMVLPLTAPVVFNAYVSTGGDMAAVVLQLALTALGALIDQAQRGPRLLRSLQGPGRGHHVVLVAHQQRVAEDHAQPPQRRADGWLGLVQPYGRARHALLADQGAQHAQQIGVEGVVTARQAGTSQGYAI